MLAHPFSTQTNEAMNKSVSAFAPKGKTFSKTESLDARVAIAAGCQILGYEHFWEQIFEEFGIVMDPNLRSFLSSLETTKQKKKTRAQTKEGKTRRSRQRCAKLRTEIQKTMLSQQDGMTYESGIAMKNAAKEAKYLSSAEVRNPVGTPKTKIRCKYFHPSFCQTHGHSSARSAECFMHSKTKEEREAASMIIMQEHIESELLEGQQKGNSPYFLHTHFFSHETKAVDWFD